MTSPLPSAPLMGGLNPTKPEKRSRLNKIIGDRGTSKHYSPTDLENIAQEYLSDMPLREGDDFIFDAKAFEDHVKGRARDFTDLQEAKIFEKDEPLYKKLGAIIGGDDDNANDRRAAIERIKTGINDVLKLTPITEGELTTKLQTAQKKYVESVQIFKELVEQSRGRRNVQDIIGVMKELVEEGKNAIKQQQSEELERLKHQFTLTEFKKDFQTGLNITEAQIENVQHSLIADLEDTHKKQIEAFDKSTQESEAQLHNTSTRQRQAFLFIASLHKNDANMQREIEKIADANRNLYSAQNMEVAFGADKKDIFSVNLDQLKFIQLIGGGEIRRASEQPISYQLDMGMRLFNPRYYLNDRASRDMLILAQAIRASGSSSITMKLDFSNQKIAEQRGREAYEACIKAGFPPEKIKLNINGKLMSYNGVGNEKDSQKYESIQERLYSKKGSEFALLEQRSKTIQDSLQNITSTPKTMTKAGMNEIRKEMEDLRASAQAKAIQNVPNEKQTSATVNPGK
ncbi:hypothetical protein [Legionella sp.]|uniref:hypothetical protein n=1 Tax=Legionella sp. TaxID=459 RepID=UPI003CA0CCA2